MFSLSRAIARTSAQSLKTVVNKKTFAARGMSTLLDAKEHAEEARFIRQMEARQNAEVRAKLEKILALEDHHEDKKELVELLGEWHTIFCQLLFLNQCGMLLGWMCNLPTIKFFLNICILLLCF